MVDLVDNVIEANQRAFQEQLPKLLEESEGRFAVGRVGHKFTCWDTYNDAIQYGYLQYGLDHFLVKQVERPGFERTLNIMYTASVA